MRLTPFSNTRTRSWRSGRQDDALVAAYYHHLAHLVGSAQLVDVTNDIVLIAQTYKPLRAAIAEHSGPYGAHPVGFGVHKKLKIEMSWEPDPQGAHVIADWPQVRAARVEIVACLCQFG